MRNFHAPCHSCAPTLCAAGSGDGVSVTCMLVIAALSEDGVNFNGRWTLSSSQKTRLLDHIESCSNQRVDGKLSKSELLRYVENEENRRQLRKLPCAVHGLTSTAMVDEVFDLLDVDKSGQLDNTEWSAFLEMLSQHHYKYLLMKSFQGFRAFYGRGQTLQPTLEDTDAERREFLSCSSKSLSRIEAMPDIDCFSPEATVKIPVVQFGRDPDCEGSWPLPPGLLEDLAYYSANNHPFHSIFCCDPENALSWLERCVMEVTTVALTLFSGFFHKEWVVEERPPGSFPALGYPYVFSVVMITLPGLLVWWTLFLLFTCPCGGQVNLSRATKEEERRAARWSYAGASIGYLLFAIGLSALFLPSIGADFMQCYGIILLARVRGYVINWLLMVFIYFNPFLAWGQANPRGPPIVGDLIGLGQWRIEKQKYLARCRDALSMGDSEAVLSSSRTELLDPAV
eukprot:TRINITY_DN29861_c0_g1_i2.p1 TRINITY_DN29861_c0_g1~~TRINITY_DN29861_c0_g1_i2.p1  ORF type:complete len:455 (+),score=76.08 TRINITY_DN29861_c0_g1_i2:66-1430(+)